MAMDLELLRQYKEELGFYPATSNPEDIERHRRLNRALEKAPTRENIAKRYRHLHAARSKTS